MDPKLKERLGKRHVCIRIWEDDYDDFVVITDEDGNPLQEVAPALVESNYSNFLKGPQNTYRQALWFKGNSTCVWHSGRLY